MTPGDLLEVEVGPVAHGGHCVARHEGRVVFVRHALPGELVRVRITDDSGGSYSRGDAVEILRASPDRVAPPCPWSGPGRCGGCDFQHVSAAAQRALKAFVVSEQLARLGGLPDVEVVVEELPGGPLGWRTRMQFAVDRRGRAGLRRHRSHSVVPIGDCPIAHPSLDSPSVLARRWPGARGVEISGSSDRPRSVRRHGQWGSSRVEGPPAGRERAAGRDWQVSAGAFWQVHPAAADVLSACVLDMLAPQPGERCVDLYGGVGLYAGVLAEAVGAAGSVLCVESDAVAVADAAINLASTPWAAVRRAAVDGALVAELPAYDLVVLDPPRSGAGRAVCEALAGGPVRAIAYVACDPAALARDLRTLTAIGWRLVRLRAFDLFPMTHHVECVALIEKETSS
ncbi:MAG: class I SAM-dependent RNA methyltransferase [Geodermatophilaceae bacterium]|nr:class I SAM-dependent RNA methyltransferase [Geodermatophilaceae bacterium]